MVEWLVPPLVFIIGVIWLGSLIKRLTIAINELRNVKREIVKVQQVNLSVKEAVKNIVFSQNGNVIGEKREGNISAGEDIKAGRDIKTKSN